MTHQTILPFDNSYAALPEKFYARQLPTPVSTPAIMHVNHQLASELGIDPHWLESDEGIAVLAGNSIPEGAEPIAAAYAGHQFGGWNPQLGDGRAVLLGELTATSGQRYDWQLKGSGPTPWSRGGDGRAPIGPVLREYILSEAMAVLGVPTTRALAAVTTGERVMRDDPQPGAVLSRVASSHIRIGTFQYFAARKDDEAVQILVDHVIARHYPEAASAENPALAMLNGAVARQAELIAKWQLLGFVHGVMNTDNVLLSGDTVDYGPCAFIDEFHPDKVFSSIDRQGRYAYCNQPAIGHWNLSNLAQTLLPILDKDQDQAVALAQESINAFPALFEAAHRAGMNQKLGITATNDGDESLIEDLLALMAEEKADFTLTFRRLADLADEGSAVSVADLYEFSAAFLPWLDRWRQRTAADSLSKTARQKSMYLANPVFIPRNHLVEEVIQAALQTDDLAPFKQLLAILEEPHVYKPDLARYAKPPQASQVVTQTFCGT
jgi:uncharacterized protein YdiU (UPF0061 family)